MHFSALYARAAASEPRAVCAPLREFIETGAGSSVQGMAYALTLLARAELALGEHAAAWEDATQGREIAEGTLDNPLMRTSAVNLLAAAALAQGEPTQAEQLAQTALAEAAEHDIRPQLPVALEVLAGAAGAHESWEEAARILGAAQRLREELALARWASEDATVEQLRERLADELGERGLVETIEEGRAMSTADALGWLRRARGARKRPAGGWESLTPTELRVAELAAEGLTNPEIGERMFIARGTVKIHLSHVYAKLEVRNRSELAALVSRR
jgi:DNA-binding CsgD family transcriptional regulator